MDKYIYLIGGLLPTFVAFGMLWFRRDLLKIALVYGSIGGAILMITEFLYTRDYWSPPTILGSRFPVESFIFGFGITTFPLLSYPVMRGKTFASSGHQRHLNLYLLFLVVAAGVLFGGSLGLGANSILLSIILLAVFTTTVCLMRRDLTMPAIFAVIVTTAISLVGYVLIFDVLSPHFWDKYSLLNHSRLGVKILGDVPVIEILCYVAWSGFAVTQHPFISGERFTGWVKDGGSASR